MPEHPPLSSLDFGTLNHWFARLDQYVKARFRSKFARTVRALAPHIPPGGTLLDIGANHGRFAKELAQLHGGSCAVHCFEPLDYNLSLLRRVVGRYPNVQVHDFALSDQNGAADLFIPAKRSLRILHGSAHLGDIARGRGDAFATDTSDRVYRQEVRTRTLDEAAPALGINSVAFMKIDVEGAEHLLLAGARKTLRSFRPVLFLELMRLTERYFGHPVEQTVAMLHDMGYRLHALDEQSSNLMRLDGWRPDVRDYVCVHAGG